MSLEAARRRGKHVPRRSHRPQLLQYADHVRYTEQLGRYHERFGGEQVQVLIYEDFRADNEATVRQVLRFLEVDDTRPIDVLTPIRRSRSARSSSTSSCTRCPRVAGRSQARRSRS
jgi:hypothetical protein